MPLSADDVVNKRFNQTKFREGYDQDEVDDFLDEVVAELRRLTEEGDELRRQLSQCEGRVAELSRGGGVQSNGQIPSPVLDPILPKPPSLIPAAAPEPALAMAPPSVSVSSASSSDVAGMLALAQRLHDEHVRNGQQERDKILTEAQETAGRLVREAEDKQRQTLGSLEQERSLLERKIDELRSFEREYRSRLKSYLENQLRDLDNKGQVVPSRTPVPAGAAVAGPSPIRNSFQPEEANVGGFPFGGQG